MTDQLGGPHDTVPMRAGEVLDAAALIVWMHAHHAALLGADATPLTITQYPGGFSNLTYRVDGAARPLVLRRPPRGVTRGPAHDVTREHRVLVALHAAGVPVPEPLACCTDEHVLGAPFFLMARVEGVILREAPPAGVAFDARVADALADRFVQQLAALHALDVSQPALAELGRGAGYVSRQVHGWRERWERVHPPHTHPLDAVADWLDQHQPPDAGVSLLHNDFKFDNLVLDPADLTHVRAILDWEMATVGCPLMDLGTTLAYWVEANDPPLLRRLGLGVTAASGMPSRAELVARYASHSGRAVHDALFYRVYGLFKLAVVAQQIAARFEQGLTSDPRFAQLDESVTVLAHLAVECIASDRI